MYNPNSAVFNFVRKCLNTELSSQLGDFYFYFVNDNRIHCSKYDTKRNQINIKYNYINNDTAWYYIYVS